VQFRERALESADLVDETLGDALGPDENAGFHSQQLLLRHAAMLRDGIEEILIDPVDVRAELALDLIRELEHRMPLLLALAGDKQRRLDAHV
jgi:hypothetical protein